MRSRKFHKGDQGERGAALVEFTLGVTVFLTAIFAVLEFGVLLWTHNALTDASRRGARYAVTQCKPGDATCPNSATTDERIKNVVVYGEPNPQTGTQPLIKGMTASNVKVEYPGFALGTGRVTVSIESYDFNFVVPLLGKKIRMPAYRTTLTGESAGLVPANI